MGAYYRDAGFADAVATDSNGRSERFPVRVLDQIGFSKWLGIRAGFRLTGVQQGNAQVTSQNNPSSCERMAQDAQRIYERVRATYPNGTHAFTLQLFNRVFGIFTYGTYMEDTPLGWITTTRGSDEASVAVSDNGVSSGGLDIWARNYQGQDGFDRRFWEGSDPTLDQIHHFGAYFSGGLTGHDWILNLHRAKDDNDGDKNLGRQAQLLGRYIKGNPTRLSSIGTLITNTICKGESVPR